MKAPRVPVRCRFLGSWCRNSHIVGLEWVPVLDMFNEHLGGCAPGGLPSPAWETQVSTLVLPTGQKKWLFLLSMCSLGDSSYQSLKSLLMAQESCFQPVPSWQPSRLLQSSIPRGAPWSPADLTFSLSLWDSDASSRCNRSCLDAASFLDSVAVYVSLIQSLVFHDLTTVNIWYKLNNPHLYNSKRVFFILTF